MNNLDKIPPVGFLPGFFDLGETYPILEIAEHYQKLGGIVQIYSHGGEYERLAKEKGFNVIKIEPIASGPDITRYFLNKSDEEIIKLIKKQSDIFKNNKIKSLVQTCSYLDCILTSYYEKIPLISVVSGAVSTPFFQQKKATFPDNMESYFTKIIPQTIKNQLTNWHTLHYEGPITKKFNRIASKLKIPNKFNYFQDIRMGNYTLIGDDLQFLGIKPNNEFPEENFIGPILSDELFNKNNKLETEILNHLTRPGKSILLSMGSSKIMKALFLDILEILNNTDYNVIATYTNLLNESDLGKYNDNILLKKFITNIARLNKMIDIAIIHGGRGTVYNAAYSGKPAVGIPLNGEQQFNIDNLVRHKTGVRISKTFFNEKKLLKSLNHIFDNYEFYLANAKTLSEKLPAINSGKKAAKRILDIVKLND